MRTPRPVLLAAFLYVVAVVGVGVCQDQPAVPLPSGVKAVWDLSKAYHETTPTRERICINGLWQWQPGEAKSDQPPSENWGYFKVPGNWPTSGGGRLKNSQRVYAHPSWKDKAMGGIATAWYQREISVPSNWTGRRIAMKHGVSEFQGRGVRRWQEGGRDFVSVGRSGPYLDVPAGQQAPAQYEGDGSAVKGDRSGVQRQQRAPTGERRSGAARPVRRRLSRQ